VGLQERGAGLQCDHTATRGVQLHPSGLANGNYTVTPSTAGFTIGPDSQVVTVNGANVTAVTFTAAAQTGSLSGTLTQRRAGRVDGDTEWGGPRLYNSDGSGELQFRCSITNGNYARTPGPLCYSFNPTSQAVETINGAQR